MGIKSMAKRIGGKAADGISKLSSLSAEQLQQVQEQRAVYLNQMPEPNDTVGQELTEKLLAVCGVEIFNAYLPQIEELYSPVQSNVEYDGKDFDCNHNIRYFDITKWVTDKKENSIEKLVNVYAVLSNEACNIALIFQRTCEKSNVYLAVVNTDNSDSNKKAESYRERLVNAIRGNFPGAECHSENNAGIVPCLNNSINYSVASASNIPTEKSEKFISQTIEKLLDGNIPEDRTKEYILILLATPILDVEERKLHLSTLYSALAPYSSWSTQFTLDEHSAFGSSATAGLNIGASVGVQKGINSSTGTSTSETDTTGTSEGETQTSGTSKQKGRYKGSSDTLGVNVGIGKEGSLLNGGVNYSHGWNRGKSWSKTLSESLSKTISSTTSKAVSKAASVTSGVFSSASQGLNFGANFARSSNVTATLGKSEGITQNYMNHNIKHALELLDQQMKRYEQSTALGLWDFAAYVLSEDYNIANNVAHSYMALTQGEESYMSKSAINLWRGDTSEHSDHAKEICKYLRTLRHPIFGLDPAIIAADSEFNVYPSIVTATTPLSGKELAYSLNFPQHSVSGLPVLECAEFGRNIVTYDTEAPVGDNLELGQIFHMNHRENTKVAISKDSLASHTFITGSTGSGKSNTVYQIISEADKQNVRFLVVEPAKGEYKHVFGTRTDVNVYGTNAKIMPLLRINPFSFDDEIHVLEHIDRLVEIFNVCWPMYAAMPAVLKNAVEKSYEDCGWNLTDSTNEYGTDMYPTFADVARNVKEIIDTSAYDAENKGAYKGSLLTRLQSLTNGIYGQIFTTREIPNEKVFDENTIIDLSRVGSSETKSLIMGLIVLKLQEYRTSTADSMNAPLKHITVLEEAHNILKRTSTEQVSETANLTGKSVEMISNAIAEMRTYGEGFIIADQSPGLLDMSAIRNTNTKIIMRLPDQSDRELVGYAANLNDDQIKELAKLPKGVAAVYQNEWVQPVLCKVNKYYTEDAVFSYNPVEELYVSGNDIDNRLKIAELLSDGTALFHEYIRDEVKPILATLQIDDSYKVAIVKMLINPAEKPRMKKLASIYNALFPEITEAVQTSYNDTQEPVEWTNSAEYAIVDMGIKGITPTLRKDLIQGAVIHYLINVLDKNDELTRWDKLGEL